MITLFSISDDWMLQQHQVLKGIWDQPAISKQNFLYSYNNIVFSHVTFILILSLQPSGIFFYIPLDTVRYSFTSTSCSKMEYFLLSSVSRDVVKGQSLRYLETYRCQLNSLLLLQIKDDLFHAHYSSTYVNYFYLQIIWNSTEQK